MKEGVPEGVPQGWAVRPAQGFNEYVGPFYSPPGQEHDVCGFLAEEKHGNKRGVVHGGMLATMLNVGLGGLSAHAAGGKTCAAVQLNVHFIGALQVGDFAEVRTEVMRATRSLVFVRGTMRVGDRLVASADGVWKVLEPRGEASKPS